MPLNLHNKNNGAKQASIPAGLMADYKTTFTTDAGQQVLKDLKEMFMTGPVRVPIMPGEPTIEMQAGAHNVIAFIDAMLGDDHG